MLHTVHRPEMIVPVTHGLKGDRPITLTVINQLPINPRVVFTATSLVESTLLCTIFFVQM